MEIKTRNAGELRGYFKKGAAPTERNFADFLDGMLNQKDDGVVRPPGGPLSVEARGDATGAREALALYGTFADAAPAWTLGLRCRVDPNDPATARDGLGLADGEGACRLFLDRATGRMGVGTAAAEALLHVAGGARVDGDARIAGAVTARALDWKDLPLNGAWRRHSSAFPTAEYCKDVSGFVHLRGLINGGDATSGQIIGVLPPGYRPERRTVHAGQSYSRVIRIDVTAGGEVLLPLGANSRWIALYGIIFQAAP